MLSFLGIVDSSIAAQADGAKTGNSKANNEATAFSHLLSWVGATSELKLRNWIIFYENPCNMLSNWRVDLEKLRQLVSIFFCCL